MADSGSQCVFVKTSIDTRLGLLLDSHDSVSAFKDKFCKEHELCFPSVGNITVSALKVNVSGNDYHLSDSMILKKALQGLSNEDFFLSVDLVRVQEKSELQIGEAVEKKTRKRKSKSANNSRKKPSIETPTEAKGLESGEGTVTRLEENQNICDVDQEEPVDGHTIDVEAKIDLSGTIEQDDVQKEVAIADLNMIDQDKDLENDNLLAELNQTSDDAEKEGIIGLVNATSEAIENETEMSVTEKDGDEEAKSEKPKKKKKAKKVKTPAKEDGQVASSSRNAEEDGVSRDPQENVAEVVKKPNKRSKKEQSSNIVEEDA
ncbi:unnamed protein product [Arabidopsis thaliana]|uniref:(thale cress) hypothetical protein n=1 Tax=Arabidopsis thaliana TaxID=3702 RepID=A0A7G2EXE8_ARATH|nr:unnamed protein product [Arabidopsis thaliana]